MAEAHGVQGSIGTGQSLGPERRFLPVSLVIPVRDEQATLTLLCDSIDRLVAGPAEVVLVDGGSTDDTVALLRTRAETDPRYRVVIADGTATPGRGRNLGVAAATHDWVAMTDAGIKLDPEWLLALWTAHIAAPDAGIAYGNVEFDVHSFFEECAVITYGMPRRSTPSGPCRGPSTQSFMVSKLAYEQVGGFPDLRAGEDDMFFRAIDAAGVSVAWAPRATVWWRIRPDAASTAERFRLYSYSYAMAGREAYWHRSLARSYLPVLGGLALAVVHSPRWLLLPTGTIFARVAVRMRRHASDPRTARPTPLRAGVIALLLLLTDAATAVGWWQARAERRALFASDGTGDRSARGAH